MSSNNIEENIFDFKYLETNYLSKKDIIIKLNEFIYKKNSYKNFWKWHDKEYEEEYYKPSKKELKECIKYLVNCEWQYILHCCNFSFENYVNEDTNDLDFDNPNIKWIERADNEDNVLENTLLNFFGEWDDLYVVYNRTDLYSYNEQ